MACTIGSPYGGAHGGDVTHEGNRGAVPPLCAATSRAKTVLNTGRHLKSAERQRGRGCMIRMCNTIIRMASFVQPPRQGRGPASGGEGTAERMCGVWGDATVACCRAVVRRLCGLCRGVCGRYLCASRVRWTRFAPPAASKPSAVASKDEARSRPRYGTALCTASIVHSGLCTARRRGGTVHSRPLERRLFGGPERRSRGCRPRTEIIRSAERKSWVRTFRLRVLVY